MNPMTRQWVFLEYNTGYGRWFPHAATMRAWANEQIRVYRPADNPATLVTMPDKNHWPAMSPSEYPYIATADVPEPWVSNNQIITALDEYEIDTHDCMAFDQTQSSIEVPAVPQLTPLTTLAGVLLSLGPAQEHGPPPLVLSVIENTAPETLEPRERVQRHLAADAEARYRPHWVASLPTALDAASQTRTEWALETILRSLAPPQPQPTTQSPQPTTQTQQLPPHVTAIMIQHAATTGTTCPITMEPLTTKNAAVTACGHIFDRDALTRWSADHGTCPECRSHL